MPRNKNLSQKDLDQKVRQIDSIYQEYLVKIGKLQQKQNEIIDQFVKELEQKKIEEIKKSLDN